MKIEIPFSVEELYEAIRAITNNETYKFSVVDNSGDSHDIEFMSEDEYYQRTN